MQVNGKRSEPFVIEQSVWQDCPLSPLLYVLAFEPLLRRIRDEKAFSVLRGVSFTGLVWAKVFAYVVVSRRMDILAVKKAVER